MGWYLALIAGAIVAAFAWSRLVKQVHASRLSQSDVTEEMRSRAEQAVRDAQHEDQIELDFSPESVKGVEQILGRLHDSHSAQPIDERELVRQSLQWGAYIGEVVKHLRGAEWRLDSEVGGMGSLPIVTSDGSESFPVAWCYRRIVQGEEDNVWHKFFLIYQRDAP